MATRVIATMAARSSACSLLAEHPPGAIGDLCGAMVAAVIAILIAYV
jgi:hypothetical protein